MPECPQCLDTGVFNPEPRPGWLQVKFCACSCKQGKRVAQDWLAEVRRRTHPTSYARLLRDDFLGDDP